MVSALIVGVKEILVVVHFAVSRQEGVEGGSPIFRFRQTVPHRCLCSGLLAVRLEPVEGVDDLGDLMAGATAEAVGLAGEAHESGFHFQEL